MRQRVFQGTKWCDQGNTLYICVHFKEVLPFLTQQVFVAQPIQFFILKKSFLMVF